MTVLLAVLSGGLFATAVYLLLRRSIIKLVLGLILLSNAVNLLVFTAGRPDSHVPPIIPPEATELIPPHADPLSQALILTAIVISFGVQAFALILIRAVFARTGTDDLDTMTTAED